MDWQCAKIKKSGEITFIQGFKDSKIQKFKNSKIQRFKDSIPLNRV